jgi:murein DD-endopeptidase MepM/ murein hydrolase activator NlpD
MKTVMREGGPKGFWSRHLYTIVLIGTVLLLGLVILLSVLLSSGPTQDREVVAPPPPRPVYVMPLKTFTLAQPASLDRLVEHPSLDGWWMTVQGVVLGVQEDSDVLAIREGTVVSVIDTLLQGMTIVIEHADGVVSRYFSLAPEADVEVGQTVTAGTVLGRTSDRMRAFAHHGNQLYLEITVGDPENWVDPMTLLPVAA